MFKPLRHVCLALAMAGTAVASWTSPHDLKQEEQAPSALIPFPRDVKWKDKEIKLPAADSWEHKGKDSNAAPIKTAWKKLLSDVKGKGN